MTTWLFETLMLVAFGLSWPVSIAKSLRTRFVRGKSPMFMVVVLLGYVFGIIHKAFNPPAVNAGFMEQNVVWFYWIDLLLVGADLVLYYLFRKNDTPRAQ